LAEVERVVDDGEFLPNLGYPRTIELAKGTEEQASKRERAIYRLMLLGVVEDYLVESTFVMNLASISPTGIADALVGFVKRTDPGAQRPSVAEFAAQANSMDLREAVSRAARELIVFIYDVIVESRRRSLREMYVAARDASPGGVGLRDRVLDYLTRGDISPVLETLVESTEFDYAVWEQELFKLKGVEDARELRGNSARLLASFPFNPGLLYARAYSEIIHPEGDLQDFTANLEASLTSARERYGVSETKLNEFTSRLLTSLESDSFVGLSLALDVANRLGLAAETITSFAT
jgi:ATP-dependent DNA helicase RecQ